MEGRLPALLTVEEAASVLRIGRTKAYAMAQEWRDTGGKSGLPVVDLGHVLRVPLHQLEALVGGPLVDAEIPTNGHAPAPAPPVTGDDATSELPALSTKHVTSSAKRKSRESDDEASKQQLELFKTREHRELTSCRRTQALRKS